VTIERAGLVVHMHQPGEWVSVINGKEAPVPAIPMGDDATVERIMNEGAFDSKIMDELHEIAEVRGPRLTGSQNLERAQDWASKAFREYGLTNVHMEQWGTIGVGFDRGPCSGTVWVARPQRPARRPGAPAESTPPQPAQPAASSAGASPAPSAPVNAAPATNAGAASEASSTTEPKLEFTKVRDVELTALSWSVGTPGAVRGPVIREPKDEAEYQAVKDQLKGAWILIQAPPSLGMRGIRSLISARYEMRKEARKKVAEGTLVADLPIAERLVFEPIAGYVSSSRDERVWTGAVAGWRDLSIDQRNKPDSDQPHIQIRLSDYDFINSRLADGEKVEVEFNMDHKFREGPVPVRNVIAEIKGSKYPDQCVIISGHMDSWDGPGSQGATDNGTGSAVVMEAARILSTVKARPDRTIRFILWSGEEQGLLGSKGYVEAHKSELENISAVFVDDGGTGFEAGTPAAANQVEILAAATAPMNNVFYSKTDKKFMNVDIHSTGETLKTHGGSDHASFNSAGVPGFFWDEGGRADYQFGWHTQNDRYNLAIEEYLIQSGTNAAVTAYRLGCAPTLVPRAKAETGERPNMLRPNNPNGPAAGQTPAQSPAPAPAAAQTPRN
jgi:hypothetical protein